LSNKSEKPSIWILAFFVSAIITVVLITTFAGLYTPPTGPVELTGIQKFVLKAFGLATIISLIGLIKSSLFKKR